MKRRKNHCHLSFFGKCVLLVLLCGVLALTVWGIKTAWHGKPIIPKQSGISSSGSGSKFSQTYASSGSQLFSSSASPAVSSSSEQESGSAKTAESQQVGLSHSVMIGNSYVEDLDTLGILPQMDFYDRVGLTVKTVFTLPTSMGKDPIIDMLSTKQYQSVYLLFGENELGWEGTKPFISAYEKVIDAVRSRQPHAKIYIQSIFPVSASVSAQNIENTNNARITEYNTQLKSLAAQKGAAYLDVDSTLSDKAGNLPSEAASDGIHPDKKYCELWADYLKTHG